MHYDLIQGDCLQALQKLPEQSVHTVVTSPPYFGLRDYNHEGQLGLEATPEKYVASLVDVFREVRRVLRNDGTLWLNLGDSYANDGKWGGATGGKHATRLHGSSGIGRAKKETGLKPKDLIGIPWRVALALQADGWWLRSDIIWHKPNSMPESVIDRPTKSHEYVFLLTKSSRYFYDYYAVREPWVTSDGGSPQRKRNHGGRTDGFTAVAGTVGDWSGKNKRTVWSIVTQAYNGAHFAVFPEKLVQPCVQAGTSAKGCCATCGAPWNRIIHRDNTDHDENRDGSGTAQTIGWEPSCDHHGEPTPCTVLDPFSGSGTTGLVAMQFGRRYIGIELNTEYIEIQKKRLDRPFAPRLFDVDL